MEILNFPVARKHRFLNLANFVFLINQSQSSTVYNIITGDGCLTSAIDGIEKKLMLDHSYVI